MARSQQAARRGRARSVESKNLEVGEAQSCRLSASRSVRKTASELRSAEEGQCERVEVTRRDPKLEGYANLAKYMSRLDSRVIVRSFRALSVQNVLYLQAEITHLEAKMRRLAERDKQYPDQEQDRDLFARHWASLANPSCNEAREQWDTWLLLREKLELYENALLRLAKMTELQKPGRLNLANHRIWCTRAAPCGDYPITGEDRASWDEQHREDLVSVRRRDVPQDLFSAWFSDTVVPWYHNVVGRHLYKSRQGEEAADVGVFYYRGNGLVSAITTVIASVLPVLSVVALHSFPSHSSDTMKLGLTALFAGVFSICLVLFTTARNIEIFVATVAFAAVNVVFVSNNN